MTPQERLAFVMAHPEQFGAWPEVIRAAIAAEREQCALLAETAFSRAWGDPIAACRGIAKMIRERANQ